MWRATSMTSGCCYDFRGVLAAAADDACEVGFVRHQVERQQVPVWSKVDGFSWTSASIRARSGANSGADRGDQEHDGAADEDRVAVVSRYAQLLQGFGINARASLSRLAGPKGKGNFKKVSGRSSISRRSRRPRRQLLVPGCSAILTIRYRFGFAQMHAT
jgi:hypothetical protein